MTCTCGHRNHSVVTYPAFRMPCRTCLNCGGVLSPRGCCINPNPCPCFNRQEAS